MFVFNPKAPITYVSFNQTGTLLATAANDVQINIFEIKSMTIIKTIVDEDKGNLNCIESPKIT